MIRLYNHTAYSDEVIRAVLNFAAKAAAVPGDVPVKVTYSRALMPGAVAYVWRPERRQLIGRPNTSKSGRVLACPCGWVSMSLPRRRPEPAAVSVWAAYAADWFVDVAIHEMAHITQIRMPRLARALREPSRAKPGAARRRMPHSRRPCERHADNVVDAVHQDPRREARRRALVVEMAVELEGIRRAD